MFNLMTSADIGKIFVKIKYAAFRTTMNIMVSLNKYTFITPAYTLIAVLKCIKISLRFLPHFKSNSHVFHYSENFTLRFEGKFLELPYTFFKSSVLFFLLTFIYKFSIQGEINDRNSTYKIYINTK